MELVAFTLQGYRRFVEKTSVKLQGGMVALVGPNEAGKSSLLDAIAHLHKDGEFARTERPRRVNSDTELSWHFRVETGDRAALAEVPEAAEFEQVIITKRNDGTKAWAMQPRPVRDKSHRVPLAQALRDRYNDPTVSEAANSEDLEELFVNAIEVLDRDENNFDAAEITALITLEDRLWNLSNAWAPSEEAEEGEPPADSDPPTWVTSLADDLRTAADAESQESPWARAQRILEGRLPAIHVLKAEDRALSSTYELQDEADSPSSALRHLAVLADLDLQALRDEAVSGQLPDVSTRRNRANEVLKQRFRESWGQSEVAIQLEVQGTVLHIQATTPGDKGLSTIEERSDGMRWFAALLAYCYGWAKKPIVLMDEIETHLHYDAQVDLIGVLTRQPFTSKVIYTTHSFASLPLDLGRGVRVVHPIAR